jgi:hypothetical protein
MHPLSTVLAATVYNEIESDARRRASRPRRASRLRGRNAAKRGAASPPSYGPRHAVRVGRA